MSSWSRPPAEGTLECRGRSWRWTLMGHWRGGSGPEPGSTRWILRFRDDSGQLPDVWTRGPTEEEALESEGLRRILAEHLDREPS